jgi:hypothetical protein
MEKMDSYSLSDLMEPYEYEDEVVDQFRNAAADILSTIDRNPYTGRMRDQEMSNLASLASPAMGMSGPMMGQMMDPTMMPPEMIGSQPPMPGAPMPGAMPGQDMSQAGSMQDPMGGQQADLMNNPGMNNIGI